MLPEVKYLLKNAQQHKKPSQILLEVKYLLKNAQQHRGDFCVYRGGFLDHRGGIPPLSPMLKNALVSGAKT